MAEEDPFRTSGDDPLEELALFWSQIQGTLQRLFPDRAGMPNRQAQLVKLLESHMTWGSVGLALGAIQSPWARILIPLAWVVMLASIWRVNFFAGPDKKVEGVGNLLLGVVVSFAFLGLWYVIPKAPTTEEIATEIAKRMPASNTQSRSEVPKEPTTIQSASASEIADAVVKLLPREKASAPSPLPSSSGDDRITAMTGLTQALRTFPKRWKEVLHNLSMFREERILYHQPPFSKEESKGAMAIWDDDLVPRENQEQRDALFALTSDANRARKELLAKIPVAAQIPDDTSKWISVGIANPFQYCLAPEQCSSDLAAFADYLDNLAQRAKVAAHD
jgi:hypothetical protein